MVLYSLFAVPLFALFIISYKLTAGADAKRLWIQYSRGVLSFIPTYIIYLLIAGRFPLTYSYGGIFAYYLIYNALYYSVLGGLAYILIQRFTPNSDGGSVSDAFLFLAGFFTFAAVLEVVRHFPYYDAFNLFLYPTMMLAVIAAVAFLLTRYFDSTGWVRWFYVVVGLLFVVATALVPFFYVIHITIAAVVIVLVLLVGSLLPYLVMAL